MLLQFRVFAVPNEIILFATYAGLSSRRTCLANNFAANFLSIARLFFAIIITILSHSALITQGAQPVNCQLVAIVVFVSDQNTQKNNSLCHHLSAGAAFFLFCRGRRRKLRLILFCTSERNFYLRTEEAITLQCELLEVLSEYANFKVSLQ